MTPKELLPYTKNLHVLFIEDSRTARAHAQMLLGEVFETFDMAVDGEEGYRLYQNYYEEHSRFYDMVVTDLEMPKLNGDKLSQMIFDVNPRQEIIVISGTGNFKKVVELINLGIHKFIIKPIEEDQLYEVIYSVAKNIRLSSLKEQEKKEMAEHNAVLKQREEEYLQQLKKNFKELKEKLYVDDLTGLSSRYAFIEDISLCTDKHIPIIFLIDIDSLKTYNQLYGTHIGNEILIEFSRLLTGLKESFGYSLYRISGDEFVLYEMVKSIDVDKYEITLNRLFTLLKENKIYIQSIDEYVDLNISVGISFSSDNPLGKAHMALHDAKQNGKNFATYTMRIDTTKELENTLYWKREIRLAVTEDRVVSYFQPIVNRDQEVIKYEALIRIKQYDKKGEEEIISPIHFMNIAMQTKQYSDLSYTMIEKTMTAMKEKGVSLSINMDMQDFKNKELTTMLKKHIAEFNRFNQENGTPSNYIALEILEDEAIKDYESFARQLKKFKDVGAFIAIDDFGSGYSNLSHIVGMSPQYLKIDATLIKDIATDKHAYKIVESVVQFAKALGIKTIAEYVATKEIFDIVYEIGIDEFQGYYFGEPVALDEL